jgi:hypothetical protein
MGLLDFFREPAESANAANSAPSPTIEERVDSLEETTSAELRDRILDLTESISDAQAELMMRETLQEDFSWDLISAQRTGLLDSLDMTPKARRARNEQAEKIWREDPVAGRGVDTMNEYVWGRGLPMPRALDKRIQRLIRSFWEDPDNKLILTSYEAQVCKGTELTLFGELFLVLFDQGEWSPDDLAPPEDEEEIGLPSSSNGAPNGSGPNGSAPNPTMQALLPPSEDPDLTGRMPEPEIEEPEAEPPKPGEKQKPEPPPPPSAVKLGQIHPNEIEDVIPDEENAAKPRYYKRVIVKKKYDYTGDGSWAFAGPQERITRYYEDLFYPPEPDQSSPPQSKMGEGKILHIMVNRHSFQLRGNSELWRAVRWARALNDFFTWRLTLLRALATFIFRKKVKGGSQAVVQAAQRMVSGMGRTGLPADFDPVAPPAPGSVLTENQNENLEQFKTTSGAGEAEQDAQMLRGQVGVALGLPIHYLGDKGSANLANATAMEQPVLKMMEARQELFEQMVTKVIDFCIDKAIDDGALPEQIDRTFYVEMPNIMQRSIPELVASLTNTMARLDPFATDVPLKRLTLQQVLLWLGYPDPDAVVRQVYPEGIENQQPQQPGMEPGAGMVPGLPPGAPGAPGAPGSAVGPAPNPANPTAGAAVGTGGLGIAGPFAGAPERLTTQQPFPGAHTGVTMG